jgi:hypothetical protein
VPGSLALPIAGMARGPAIDRRAPARDVLGDTRGDPELTQVHDEVDGILAPIGVTVMSPGSSKLGRIVELRRPTYRFEDTLPATVYSLPSRVVYFNH